PDQALGARNQHFHRRPRFNQSLTFVEYRLLYCAATYTGSALIILTSDGAFGGLFLSGIGRFQRFLSTSKSITKKYPTRALTVARTQGWRLNNDQRSRRSPHQLHTPQGHPASDK